MRPLVCVLSLRYSMLGHTTTPSARKLMLVLPDHFLAQFLETSPNGTDGG